METEYRAYQQQREQQGESLIADSIVRIDPHHGRDHRCDNDHQSWPRDAAQQSMPRAGEQAVKEVQDSKNGTHAGTLIFFTRSSTTPRAVSPEKRACGSMTSRCARTETASSWICSGVTKSRPSKSARA